MFLINSTSYPINNTNDEFQRGVCMESCASANVVPENLTGYSRCYSQCTRQFLAKFNQSTKGVSATTADIYSNLDYVAKKNHVRSIHSHQIWLYLLTGTANQLITILCFFQNRPSAQL
ncbi:uncharacterized protein LOC142341126 [Convolutriloba macropyga]|uniref:uncharacterized protein LOC142341126 n=1 Tax=Convolutriloba macropyga TaxID=536237 RepID=UPI003F5260A2